MYRLTSEELALLQQRLAEAMAYERTEALSSWESFLSFLRREGMYWLSERLPQLVDNAIDWLASLVRGIFNSI
jgi:transposase